jgi:photoactive yellow protein
MKSALTPFAFDAEEAGPQLADLDDTELDALPFGVVEMDRSGSVLRYNAAESQHSGLSRDRVVGRHFFRDVAPCSNNHRVAGRFEQAELDETIGYTFALRMKPVPVTLRMLKPAQGTRMYLLVKWT